MADIDLQTLFNAHLLDLMDNDAAADELTTELAQEYNTVRQTTASLDDFNTAYVDLLT